MIQKTTVTNFVLAAAALFAANVSAAGARARMAIALGNHGRAIATWRSFIDAGGDEATGRAAMARADRDAPSKASISSKLLIFPNYAG